jgi:hypothetical protein
MLNPYILDSETELLEALGGLKAERKRRRDGIQLTGSGIGGKSFSFSRMSKAELDLEFNQVIAALQAKNPTAYGQLVTQTYSDFSGTDDV